MKLSKMELVLASASPRRKELIGKIEGLEVEIIASNAEENAAFTTAGGYACALARLKAEEVYSRTNKTTVGADTVVYLDGVMGKPCSKDDAREMLKKLSGNTHSVITGVCLIISGKTVCRYYETKVTFLPFTEEFIESYIGSGSPMDKAGAYGLQDEMLAPFVSKVDGCRDNVIGLPVEMLREMLEEKNKWQN